MSTPPPGPEAGPISPPAVQPQAIVVARPPKSPGLALFLSVLFPGIGQVYNAQPAKAFTFFFGFVGSIYGAAEISPFPFAFLIPFVYFYALVDAYRSAAIANARALGGQVEAEEDNAESPMWGGALVALGLLLLLNNLGWIRLAALDRYWPLLLVVVGAFFLYGSLQRRKADAAAATTTARPSESDEADDRLD